MRWIRKYSKTKQKDVRSELLQFRGDKQVDIWTQPWRVGKKEVERKGTVWARQGKFGAGHERDRAGTEEPRPRLIRGWWQYQICPPHSECVDGGRGNFGFLNVIREIKDPESLFSLKRFVFRYGAIGSSVGLSWIPVLILASKSRYRTLLEREWKAIQWLKSEHKAQFGWVIEVTDSRPVNNITWWKEPFIYNALTLSLLMWRLNKHMWWSQRELIKQPPLNLTWWFSQ